MNLTVKVYKSWCNDVYMSILQCENCSTGHFLIRFLIPMWSSGHPLLLAASTVLHVIIYKQDIQICQICHIYSTTTLSSVLKPKYSLLIRNKCAFLPKLVLPSGVNKTPKIAIFRMCYGENGTVTFFETLADNVFKHNYPMMQI